MSFSSWLINRGVSSGLPRNNNRFLWWYMGLTSSRPQPIFTKRTSNWLPGLVNVYKKRTGKIHKAINGKSNYFDWAIFHSFLCVYQRVSQLIDFNALFFLGFHPKGHEIGWNPRNNGMLTIALRRCLRSLPPLHLSRDEEAPEPSLGPVNLWGIFG
jgi:hypothetical protein